jgi:hypothetical protein
MLQYMSVHLPSASPVPVQALFDYKDPVIDLV